MVVGQIPRCLPLGVIKLLVDLLQHGEVGLGQLVAGEEATDLLELLPYVLRVAVVLFCTLGHLEHTFAAETEVAP